jgi:hypothetical protein
VTVRAAEVDETALGEEDNVAAGRHGEAVHLGLDVDGLGGVGLEPCDVDLDVKVTDASNVSFCSSNFLCPWRGGNEGEGR